MKVNVKRIYQMVATRLNRLSLDILVASGKKAWPQTKKTLFRKPVNENRLLL